MHLVDYQKQNSWFVSAWTLSILPYRERFVEFSSVYALRWNKVIDCRDRMGRVGRLCKWLTVLVDLPTGCSRSLLLHENKVYLLICFVESMATHSSHSSYKVGMTALLGENSEGFGSKLSSQTFRLTIMRYDADRSKARSFESDECNFFHCYCIALWFVWCYRSSKCYLLHLIAAADVFRCQ